MAGVGGGGGERRHFLGRGRARQRLRGCGEVEDLGRRRRRRSLQWWRERKLNVEEKVFSEILNGPTVRKT